MGENWLRIVFCEKLENRLNENLRPFYPDFSRLSNTPLSVHLPLKTDRCSLMLVSLTFKNHTNSFSQSNFCPFPFKSSSNDIRDTTTIYAVNTVTLAGSAISASPAVTFCMLMQIPNNVEVQWQSIGCYFRGLGEKTGATLFYGL